MYLPISKQPRKKNRGKTNRRNAKLKAKNRRRVQRMRRALSEYVVTGIRTNLPFHLALMSHEKFIAGDYDTSFIAQHEDVLLTSGSAGAASEAFVVGAAVAQAFREDDAAKQASPPPANGHGASVSPWRLAALAKL